MNFFGHCVAACWRSRSPTFALGAMLPDFASMCGARVAGTDDPTLERGLAWHHETDRAFHRAPEFRDLSRALSRRLYERGASRGGALGAGHVGVELLLDGLLLDDPVAAQIYPEALAAGRTDRLGRSIRWHEEEEASRWIALRARLASYGLPDGYRDVGEVARRVTQVLSRRPRLALDRRAAAALAEELPRAREELADALPSLLARMREELAP